MKIGLTYTGSIDKHQNYVRWLQAAENIGIVKLSAEADNLDELQNCDGLVLSGGVDIYPEYYNNNNTNYAGAPEKFQQERDAFEIAAYKIADTLKLPVLGICRGMQLINVIYSGTLIQNLEGDAINETHRGNPDKLHPVTIMPNTLLRTIAGTETTTINSAHHQAIGKLGDGLLINAVAADGVVEGIERIDKENKPFLLAVQWHPERMYTLGLADEPVSKELRDTFIAAIAENIQRLN